MQMIALRPVIRLISVFYESVLEVGPMHLKHSPGSLVDLTSLIGDASGESN